MNKRITNKMVQEQLEVLRELGTELGIEGAEYWQVHNPYGPHGLHFLEVHHDDGYWVSQSTALGSYSFSGPKEAFRGLVTMSSTLRAAKRALAAV